MLSLLWRELLYYLKSAIHKLYVYCFWSHKAQILLLSVSSGHFADCVGVNKIFISTFDDLYDIAACQFVEWWWECVSTALLQSNSSDYVAKIWRRIALYSTEKGDQLKAYQNAVELLSVSLPQLNQSYVIRYDVLCRYLMCAIKLAGSQISLPHEMLTKT